MVFWRQSELNEYLAEFDIGSTTVKVVLIDDNKHSEMME